MTAQIPYRNLPQLFLSAREGMLSHFRPILTHFGLTEQQWRILRAIDEHGQLEPREICAICNILSPSLAGVLARMEAGNLVLCSRQSTDRRRVIVTLTANSIQLVATMKPLITAQYKLLEKAVGADLLSEVYQVLDKVIQAQTKPVPRIAT